MTTRTSASQKSKNIGTTKLSHENYGFKRIIKADLSNKKQRHFSF